MLDKITFKQIVDSPIGPFVLFVATIIVGFIGIYFAVVELLSDA